MTRSWGGISFHVTQLLTGHGCFGTYWHRIGKEVDPSCWQCSSGCDSPEHTLEWCPVWGVQRAELCEVVGPDVSLPTVVRRMCKEKAAWVALARFATCVMSRKEEAERVRRAGKSGLRALPSP